MDRYPDSQNYYQSTSLCYYFASMIAFLALINQALSSRAFIVHIKQFFVFK